MKRRHHGAGRLRDDQVATIANTYTEPRLDLLAAELLERIHDDVHAHRLRRLTDDEVRMYASLGDEYLYLLVGELTARMAEELVPS